VTRQTKQLDVRRIEVSATILTFMDMIANDPARCTATLASVAARSL
jgi:hypothetical protein